MNRPALQPPEFRQALARQSRSGCGKKTRLRLALANLPDRPAGHAGHLLHTAAGPVNLEGLQPLVAEPDVQSATALRQIGDPGHHASMDRVPRDGDDTGTLGGPVTVLETRSQAQLHPVALLGLVGEKPHAPAVSIDEQDVHVPVVVVVREREPTRDARFGERLAERCQVVEEVAVVVPEQERQLGRQAPGHRRLLERAAVGHRQIEPAVGIEVEELRTPADNA